MALYLRYRDFNILLNFKGSQRKSLKKNLFSFEGPPICVEVKLFYVWTPSPSHSYFLLTLSPLPWYQLQLWELVFWVLSWLEVVATDHWDGNLLVILQLRDVKPSTTLLSITFQWGGTKRCLAELWVPFFRSQNLGVNSTFQVLVWLSANQTVATQLIVPFQSILRRKIHQKQSPPNVATVLLREQSVTWAWQ